MLSKNKDYQAIKKNEALFEEANETKNTMDGLKREIRALETKEYTLNDPSTPYGKLINEKRNLTNHVETTLKRRVVPRLALYYLIILAVPLLISVTLNMTGIYAWVADAFTTLNVRNASILFIALLYLVVLILLLKTTSPMTRYLKQSIVQNAGKRFDKKHKAAYTTAKQESQTMIDEQIEADNTLKEEKSQAYAQLEETLNQLYETIENQTKIPRRLIDRYPLIKQYFEEYRAETTKEAINTLLQEEYIQQIMATITEHMNIQTKTLSSVKDRLDRLFTAIDGQNN